MRYDLQQDELIKAVEYYLNQCVLKKPITVDNVEAQHLPGRPEQKKGYVLAVFVHEDEPVGDDLAG